MSGPAFPAPPRCFDAPWLAQRLKALLPAAPQPLRLCVALSGGADSTALLAALQALRDSPRPPLRLALRAVHVDHHLQAASMAFRAQCRRLCQALGVPLSVRDARVGSLAGRSVEEAAREARYRLLAAALRPGEVLLTAQHAEDQLETVLLQLLRGGGLAGLAGMAERAALGAGELLRPLLPVSGASLRAYLAARGLRWIEDPSNAQTRFDRNYLRSQVLPPLLARWPAAAQTVARSARHAAQADASARGQAQRDADAAADGPDLALTVLRRWAPARQQAALRAWITGQGYAVPDERRLAELLRLIDLREDATPRVQWGSVQVRRHAGRLCVQAVTQAPPPPAPQHWTWRSHRRLVLAGGGTLALKSDPWGDVDLARLPAQLLLTYRLGGERVAGPAGHRDVKSLLREAGIPAWQRARVPFVCAPSAVGKAQEARLLAIGDLWIAAELQPDGFDTQRGRFIWQPQ